MIFKKIKFELLIILGNEDAERSWMYSPHKFLVIIIIKVENNLVSQCVKEIAAIPHDEIKEKMEFKAFKEKLKKYEDM